MALSFIAWGRRAAEDSALKRVRDEVLARYRDRLPGKSWLSRVSVRWCIRREIRKELKRLPPPSTLFSVPERFVSLWHSDH
jgi:hypothetical protein